MFVFGWSKLSRSQSNNMTVITGTFASLLVTGFGCACIIVLMALSLHLRLASYASAIMGLTRLWR
jgi:hypothetical protein